MPTFPTHEGDWLHLDVASGDWLARPSVKSLRSVYPGCILLYLAPGISPHADLLGVRDAIQEAHIALRYRRATNYLAMGYSVTEGVPAGRNSSNAVSGSQLTFQRAPSLPPSSPPNSSPVVSRSASPGPGHISSDTDLDWLFASEEETNAESTPSRLRTVEDSAEQAGEPSGSSVNDSRSRRYYPYQTRRRLRALNRTPQKKNPITHVDIDLTLPEKGPTPSSSKGPASDREVIVLD